MIQVIENLANWRQLRRTFTGKIGFVPTMGALHEGHASLFLRAKKETDITVASIFVNPPQFNSREDFEKYPVRMDEDLACLNQAKVDYLLLPRYQDLYADDYAYFVGETKLSHQMEGLHRPGHFNGVLTVVMKLFNLVQPHQAYFGEKDYQQYQLIRGMCEALFSDVNVIPCPTVREASGLAMSSRNLRLSAQARENIAPLFYQHLAAPISTAEITQRLQESGFQVDYVEESGGRRYGAVFLEGVRLIDNTSVPQPLAPERGMEL